MRDRASARTLRSRAAIAALGIALLPAAHAAGGPLGIDHRWNFDDSGLWGHGYQKTLRYAAPLVIVGGALWEGDDSRLGRTLWQSVDALAIGAVASEGLKVAFSRARPEATDNPNRWFQGHGNKSFPSGEVTEIATAVTPLVIEYGREYPAVWALELLPIYDGVARVKVRAHWQSDVLAGFALGTAIGAYAHSRTSSISVGLLPRGVTVGWKKSF